MRLLSLVLSVILGWTTFAGSSSRSNSTEVKVWPPFSYSWMENFGPPGTRVFTPVTFETYRICKYILRDKEYSINVKAFDRSGTLVWSFSEALDRRLLFMINALDYEGSPTIAGQMVFFTGTKKLYCLALDSGRLLWDFTYPVKETTDLAMVCPLAYGETGIAKIAVNVEDKVYIHEALVGKVLKIAKNTGVQVPPLKLTGESIICPVHLDVAGEPLVPLPKEALKHEGGFASNKDMIVGYRPNSRWFAWKLDRRYNRWEKVWEIDDSAKVESPFWSFRHATMLEDRIIFATPNKIVCVDYAGKEIWSHDSELARWNQYVPVSGNVALVTCYTKSKVLQAYDVRDGLPYDPIELPVYIQAPPVPTDDGFMVMTTGGGLWAFKSSQPPKPEIEMAKSIKIYKGWTDYEFGFGVKNVGGSRMTFETKANDLVLASMKRCNPNETVSFRFTLSQFKPDLKVTVEVDGDGGRESSICYVTVTDTEPDRLDVNLDGRIDFADAFIVLMNIGKAATGKPWEISRRCDVDGDGAVTILDFACFGVGK